MDKRYEVTDSPLDPGRYIAMVTRPEAGAVATFTGHVREWTKGRRTLSLAYEAYVPMAERMLETIAEEVKVKWPEAEVAVGHRIGPLAISDIAVVVAVSTPHRQASYEANSFIMERIKEDVPIWKKEIQEDGEWWKGEEAQ
ncbi:molybdenum cofactor biosynthesis protein MoaE [Salimicrobium jeotgali]|uniref:molybdenum cofactor biosynthesis protein MoaE n=1 Tax=Salimicrobium jeotgali TaxID=1230341 RepID=UPI000C81752A|nr:molybdenum cofactor biosynthesis protein MoaE [Salimicrobium jeotgali]